MEDNLPVEILPPVGGSDTLNITILVTNHRHIMDIGSRDGSYDDTSAWRIAWNYVSLKRLLVRFLRFGAEWACVAQPPLKQSKV
jgi:hypothetical protein